MSATALENIVIDANFKGIPGTKVIDWALLSFVRNLSKGGFVSVSYIAECLGYERETVSRKLAYMVKAGWLGQMKINFKKFQYVLTQKTLNAVALYIQKKKEEKRERIRLKNEAIRQAKQQKSVEAAAFSGSVESTTNTGDKAPTKDSKPTIDPYSEENRTKFKKIFESSGLPEKILSFTIDDYIDFCQGKESTPSRTGLNNRIESAIYSQRRALKGMKKAEQLSQAKDRHDENTAKKIHQAADQMEPQQHKTTAEKLTDTRWSDQPSPFDLIDILDG